MELVFELTHSLFKVASIFSFVSAGLGDVLAPGNSTKKMDTMKGKCETMELRCSTFQEELVAL